MTSPFSCSAAFSGLPRWFHMSKPSSKWGPSSPGQELLCVSRRKFANLDLLRIHHFEKFDFRSDTHGTGLIHGKYQTDNCAIWLVDFLYQPSQELSRVIKVNSAFRAIWLVPQSPARLIPQYNRCILGMWIPLIGLLVLRNSVGRLVWGKRCSAANGGRKYKQLLWPNSTMESVWCEDCVICRRWGCISKVRRGDVSARAADSPKSPAMTFIKPKRSSKRMKLK